jgi:MFS family permease
MNEVHTVGMIDTQSHTLATRTSLRIPSGLAFGTTAAALAAFFVAAGAPTPLLPRYQAEWGFAPSLVTLAFGIYAVALLASLLVFGSLSDHIGRRPLLIASLVVELVSMGMFLLAPSIGWIIAARVFQGIATGAATTAFSAAVVELAPTHRKRLGARIVGVLPAVGLGVGALASGVIAHFDTGTPASVWAALVVVMAVGTVFAILTPETVTALPGALGSLIPRVSVPRPLKRQFSVTVLVQIGSWMTSALFLGLMPTVLRVVYGVDDTLVSGLIAFVALAAAAVGASVTGSMASDRVLRGGGIAIAVGAASFVAGVVLGALPLLWVAALVAGAGLGANLSATIRSLIPHAEAHQRAGLFAAIYLVTYAAFGIPAILAGALIASVGIGAASVVYGTVAALVALIGVVVLVTRRVTPTD